MNWDLEPSVSTEVQTIQFIAFEVGSDRFALPIQHVIEFRTWIEPTIMPNAPHYMRGIINVRGEIIPIYDLAARIGRPLTDATPKHVVILAQNADAQITGVLVDSVSDILSINQSGIAALPRIEGGEATPFLSGVISVDSELLGIIDVDKLVRESQIAQTQPALGGPT
jgi:purine-binding chemotaxis protein CheW